ncbi:hypothetical protein OHA38_43280 (plasmid) [Streptomyces sp. NBC_01732]|uniref:hypothetical protein n=1 Tax=Streptomyces sp. NBC_01732 TaxID=2975926 RepID=UPI00352DD949|nr:hypothetical protein OHA38_43280 [Streptomyces sp. NBC_01732]
MIAVDSGTAVAERAPKSLRGADADSAVHRVVDEAVLDRLCGDLNAAFDGPPLSDADLRELRQRIQSSLGRVIANIPCGMTTPGGPLASAVSSTRVAMRLDAQDCAPDPAPPPRVALARLAAAGSALLDELSEYGLIPAADNLVDSIPVPPP